MSEEKEIEEINTRLLILETQVKEIHRELKRIRGITWGFEKIGGASP